MLIIIWRSKNVAVTCVTTPLFFEDHNTGFLPFWSLSWDILMRTFYNAYVFVYIAMLWKAVEVGERARGGRLAASLLVLGKIIKGISWYFVHIYFLSKSLIHKTLGYTIIDMRLTFLDFEVLLRICINICNKGKKATNRTTTQSITQRTFVHYRISNTLLRFCVNNTYINKHQLFVVFHFRVT